MKGKENMENGIDFSGVDSPSHYVNDDKNAESHLSIYGG